MNIVIKIPDPKNPEDVRRAFQVLRTELATNFSALGTMAEQDADNVNITGGTVLGCDQDYMNQMLDNIDSWTEPAPLGNMANQDADNVNITGGTVLGCTPENMIDLLALI